jgi:hypothetical protein
MARPGVARRGKARRGRARQGKARIYTARQLQPQERPNKMRIDIEIEGTTPLLMNQFTDAAAQAATDGTRSSMAGDRGTPLDIAETKIYRDLDGKIVIPQPNLLRCLVDGGIFHKSGRSKITTQKSSLLYACVDIEGAVIPLIHRQPWKVYTRPVRIPATGGRILCHRPMFDDWKLAFTANLDTEMVSPGLLRMVLDDSGKKIGLGDFRPNTKGPYGKFVVTLWRVVPEVPLKLKAKAA